MPRPIWRGAISFGLVTIPVQVVGATESHDLGLHRVHTVDSSRVRNRKVCEIDGGEVPNEDIAKGYPVGKDTVVTLTDDELDQMPIPTAKTLEILAFIPGEDIDPLQLDRAYYMQADGPAAAKPYVLLRDALVRSGKAAVGKVALRGKEVLAMIRVVDDALTMHTMLWPDEIRPHAGMAPDREVQLTDEELQRALELMDSMDQVPEEELHDDYTRALEQVVTAKLEHRPPPKIEQPEAPRGGVVDLMAALEQSVRKTQEARGGQPKESGAKKKTATRKTAKKTPAKKTTSKPRKRA
ncbi:Ku protein [Streptomyces sp. NPDC004647]|uniref:non-homologous end joining protein Ku n=1 Tax=Streptomyces sp. NPDC004647 TaxID=3154671 RepID=UPI0033ADD1CE